LSKKIKEAFVFTVLGRKGFFFLVSHKRTKPKRKGLINFEYLEIQSIYTTNGPTAKWNDTDQ